MTEEECKDCRAHSGMEESLKNIKTWEEEAKKILQNVVTGKTAWGFFTFFILLCMAVVGFIWHGQTSIANRVDAGLKETMHGVNRIDSKMQIIEYKVDQHLIETEDLKREIHKKK